MNTPPRSLELSMETWFRDDDDNTKARPPQGANQSLSAVEPVSAPPKRKLENRQQRPAPETRPARTEIPEIADQRLGRPSLTRGNVADSHTPGNKTSETRLPGCPQRIRTQNCNLELSHAHTLNKTATHPGGLGEPVVIPTKFTEDVRAVARI